MTPKRKYLAAALLCLSMLTTSFVVSAPPDSVVHAIASQAVISQTTTDPVYQTIPLDVQLTITNVMQEGAATTVPTGQVARDFRGNISWAYYTCQPYPGSFPSVTLADAPRRGAVSNANVAWNDLVLTPWNAANPVAAPGQPPNPNRTLAVQNQLVRDYRNFVNDTLASMGMPKFYFYIP